MSEPGRTVAYSCQACGHELALDVDAEEYRSSLRADREEACPRCGQRVGFGTVRCRVCGAGFEVRFPHLHVACDLANDHCPSCGAAFVSPCIC